MNGCSISYKRHELIEFLGDQQVHVFLIAEIWLRSGDKFFATNFKTYRFDRHTGRDGAPQYWFWLVLLILPVSEGEEVAVASVTPSTVLIRV